MTGTAGNDSSSSIQGKRPGEREQDFLDRRGMKLQI